MIPEVPVLVVGGGPVGLSMALFLARHGVPALLVERRSTTSPMPRATHVTRRTMELFAEAGLREEIAAAGLEVVPEDDPRVASAPDRTLPRVVLGSSSLADLRWRAEVLETGAEELAVPGQSPPFWCGQDKLEPILRNAAVRAGADVRFGHELVHLDVGRGAVLAHIHDRNTGQTHVCAPRFVVAADGGAGRVAETVGIPFTGLGMVARRVSILFRADLDHLVRHRRFFMAMIENPGFSGAVMQLGRPDRWAAAVDAGAVPDLSPARCMELVRAAIGDPAVRVALDGCFPWTARHRVAQVYRAGPVFLAGDAAHLHPPAGGFGSNVGFQDAHNLAWKIAAVLRGWADESLVDTYDAERRPVGTATAVQTLLLDGIGPERLAGATPCDQRVLIMGYRYDSRAVLGASPGGPFPEPFDLSGAPGTRVPHVPVGAGATLDVVGAGFVVFSADAGWRQAATGARQALGVPVAGHTVDEALAAGFAEACGTGGHGAVLVRPDGFVAWRRPAGAPLLPHEMESQLTAALGRVTGLAGRRALMAS